MKSCRAALAGISLCLFACGSSVAVDPHGSGATVSASAATGAGASGSVGSVGSATSIVASSASGTGGGFATSSSADTGTTGGGASAPCSGADDYLDVNGNGMSHLTTGCNPGYPPYGYRFQGGGAPTKLPGGPVQVYACEAGSPIRVVMFTYFLTLPGQSSPSTIQFTNALGDQYTANDAVVDVSAFGDVGGSIEGSFKAYVTGANNDGGTTSFGIGGTFRVCRYPDMFAP